LAVVQIVNVLKVDRQYLAAILLCVMASLVASLDEMDVIVNNKPRAANDVSSVGGDLTWANVKVHGVGLATRVLAC
jgi:hypothetical protein